MYLLVMLSDDIFCFSFFFILQGKDTTDSRSRVVSNTSSRGGGARVSADRYVGRGGATQFSSGGGKRMLVAIFE